MTKYNEERSLYENAFWGGSVTVQPGKTTELSGELTVLQPPWERGISLEDFHIEGEKTLYETAFEEKDSQMGPISHQGDTGESRLDDGKLVASGQGDLDGELSFQSPSGRNHIIRFRAWMPEGGQFAVNTRRQGRDRFELEVNQQHPNWDSSIMSLEFRSLEFNLVMGKALPVPNLEPGRWYDYALLDTGERVFVFLDQKPVSFANIYGNHPDTGSLSLEWDRPCQFDSLSVSSIEGLSVPEQLNLP